MDDGVAFEPAWEELRPRLYRMLVARGTPPHLADDVVQEAALKLLSSWPRLDLGQPLWPLARTVTLNCLSDSYRRTRAVPVPEVPDAAADYDVEDHAIARVRLGGVAKVIETLRAGDRTALLEVIEPTTEVPRSSAAKMARMRARRRLATAMERSHSLGFALIPLSWRRLQLWVNSQPVAQLQGAASSIAAAAVAVTFALGPMDGKPARPHSEARKVQAHRQVLVKDTQPSSKQPARRKVQRRTPRPTQPAPLAAPSTEEGATTLAHSEEPPQEDHTDPVRVGPAEADTNEGRGYKNVTVCTGGDSPEEEDDQETSVTVNDGNQQEGDPEPQGCE